jgi:K+-transporting ATPase ATPase B chain
MPSLLQDPPTGVPFTAQTRMSGVNLEGKQIRKGAANSIRQFVGGILPAEIEKMVETISLSGGTPLVVAQSGTGVSPVRAENERAPHGQDARATTRVLGVIH